MYSPKYMLDHMNHDRDQRWRCLYDYPEIVNTRTLKRARRKAKRQWRSMRIYFLQEIKKYPPEGIRP